MFEIEFNKMQMFVSYNLEHLFRMDSNFKAPEEIVNITTNFVKLVPQCLKLTTFCPINSFGVFVGFIKVTS